MFPFKFILRAPGKQTYVSIFMYFIVIYINIGTKRSINKLSYFLWQIHWNNFQMRNNHEKQIKLLKVYLNDSIKKTLAQNQFRSFETSLGVLK